MKYARHEEDVKIYLDTMHGQEYDAGKVVYLLDGCIAEFSYSDVLKTFVCYVYPDADSCDWIEEIFIDYDGWLNNPNNRIHAYTEG